MTASPGLRLQLIALLDQHYGGWLDPNTDRARCPCGHRPTLGESHSAHVTDEVMKKLFVADLRWEGE